MNKPTLEEIKNSAIRFDGPKKREVNMRESHFDYLIEQTEKLAEVKEYINNWDVDSNFGAIDTILSDDKPEKDPLAGKYESGKSVRPEPLTEKEKQEARDIIHGQKDKMGIKYPDFDAPIYQKGKPESGDPPLEATYPLDEGQTFTRQTRYTVTKGKPSAESDFQPDEKGVDWEDLEEYVTAEVMDSHATKIYRAVLELKRRVDGLDCESIGRAHQSDIIKLEQRIEALETEVKRLRELTEL